MGEVYQACSRCKRRMEQVPAKYSKPGFMEFTCSNCHTRVGLKLSEADRLKQTMIVALQDTWDKIGSDYLASLSATSQMLGRGEVTEVCGCEAGDAALDHVIYHSDLSSADFDAWRTLSLPQRMEIIREAFPDSEYGL